MQRKNLGYVGLLLVLVSVVLFIVASKESRYESAVVRVKGVVLAKRIRPLRLGHTYDVTYRTTVLGRTLEREGDVGSQKKWDSMRIGDEVDVECIGVAPEETRLAAERTAGSVAYRWLAAGFGAGGLVLIGLRVLRRGKGER